MSIKVFVSSLLICSGMVVSFSNQAVAEGDGMIDTSPALEAIGQYEEYKPEQEPRAVAAVNKVKKDSVVHHPYHDGTASEQIPKDNTEFDIEVILNDKTYDECMQYQIIGTCLTPTADGGVVETPYVRYWGPFQKGEEVPEPFRTGYVYREEQKKIKDELLETYYSEFMKEVIPAEYKFGTSYAVTYLNKAFPDLKLTPPPEMTPDQRVIDATKEAIETYGENNLGESSMFQDGYVFNDYHLFPSGVSNEYVKTELPPGGAAAIVARPSAAKLRDGRLPLLADIVAVAAESGGLKIPKTPEFIGFCHNKLQVGTYFSEYPDNIVYSRISESSFKHFSSDMKVFTDNPLTCLDFNRKSKGGKTDDKVADIDPKGGGGEVGPCQGVNQGLWLPVTNIMHTMYPMTAAALGLTKSVIARKLNPSNFYNIVPKDDKVQWIRNERMDGINSEDGKPDVINEKTKRCDKLAKWVLQYEKGNMKISPDEKMDYWSVIAHWRKIRCCPLGGAPVLVDGKFADKETIEVIVE